MSTNRPKVMVDEQAFQDMLAAAFTIQEHNAQRRKKAAAPEHVCGRCGTAVSADGELCPKCVEEPRQGEELQRKWASLWLMSQEQGLGPESFAAVHDGATAETMNADLMVRRFPEAEERPATETEVNQVAAPEAEPDWGETSAIVFHNETGLHHANELPELAEDIGSEPVPSVDEAAAAPGSLRDLRLKLRFHRADFYLVVAVAVSTVAMVWVLSATPALGAHQKPRLRPWERALISLGLAEAPEPAPKHGNPNLSVWVDPKTALYYCVGEELYGKAPGGHLATQREAQLDQFEPAGRAACE